MKTKEKIKREKGKKQKTEKSKERGIKKENGWQPYFVEIIKKHQICPFAVPSFCFFSGFSALAHIFTLAIFISDPAALERTASSRTFRKPATGSFSLETGHFNTNAKSLLGRKTGTKVDKKRDKGDI